MRKNNRKGFTIVELIIVIAVIAILAGVLIPTFSSIISKANASKALQEAQNAYKEAYALAVADGEIAEKTVLADKTEKDGEVISVGEFTFTFTGDLESFTCAVTEPANFGYDVTVSDKGVVSVKAASKATE